jgi:hypothetical protein
MEYLFCLVGRTLGEFIYNINVILSRMCQQSHPPKFIILILVQCPVFICGDIMTSTSEKKEFFFIREGT